MAGEIDVTIVGRAAKLIFQGDHIVLRCTDVRTAFAIMKAPTPNLEPLGNLLTVSKIGLMACVGEGKPFQIFPGASRVARWISSKVRELNGSS